MYPRIEINLRKIKENAALTLGYCRRAGIEPCAVTKAVCGDPAVGRALLEAGFTRLADSRMENIARLRSALGDAAELLMLRLPAPSQAAAVARECDLSLHSEPAVLELINEQAGALGLRHPVILMVDLGDLREGIWPDDLAAVRQRVERLPHIRVAGLGTNLTCYGGVIPTRENLARLVELKEEWERAGGPLDIVSGGNSSSLPLVIERTMPEGINHLRLGESIMLGRETAHGSLLPGAHPDAFILQAEVIELKEKPSLPTGTVTRDAFGCVPRIEDRGVHRRAILALGRQDTTFTLQPLDPALEILGGSSDHLLLDAAKTPSLKLGDIASFIPSYGALLAAMTSPYVKKVYI